MTAENDWAFAFNPKQYENGKEIRYGISTSGDIDGYNGYIDCYTNEIHLFYDSSETVITTLSGSITWEDKAKLITLVNAMQNFGCYMQNSGWTDNKTHETIYKVEELDENSINAAQTGVADKAIKQELAGSGISESTFSLTLNSDTVIRLLIKLDSGVTIESPKPDNENSETGQYEFISSKIGAANLDKDYTFNIKTSQGNATVTASALSYVNAVLEGESFDAVKKYAMTAYYNYHIAAETYVESKNS